MVRPFVAALLLLAACDHGKYGSARTHAKPVPLAEPFADEVPAGPPQPGPLSPDRAEIAMTWGSSAWYELGRTTYLDAARLRADAEVVQAQLGAMPVLPGSPGADRWPTWLAQLPDLARTAPYSLVDTMIAYQQGTQLVCARAPGAVFGCNRDRREPRAPIATTPFAISAPAPGVRLLRVDDLSAASAAAWAALTTALPWDATPLVLDMRDARGNDPRPLLAWLEQAVGRQPLRPLQRIDAPAALEPLVAAYRARYADGDRDDAVWASLVATTDDGVVTTPPKAPAIITIVVGPGCEAACELVARVLETYVGAEVYGTVGGGSRLGQDHPALLRLPASGLHLYFYAATYQLSAEIEARTGPTGAWGAVRTGASFDDAALAGLVSWTQRRMATPGWPVACRELVVADAPSAIATPKLAGLWTGSGMPMIARIKITVPTSIFLRWLAACPGAAAASPLGDREVTIYGGEQYLDLLHRAAESDLVERIDGEPDVPPVIHNDNAYDR